MLAYLLHILQQRLLRAESVSALRRCAPECVTVTSLARASLHAGNELNTRLPPACANNNGAIRL
ncbi:hypothetical protein OKW41_002499 [Paraburkholderia sp. UCT70]